MARLAISAGQRFLIDNEPAASDFDVIAVRCGESVTVIDRDDLEIGVVDGISGVTTGGEAIRLKASSGTLTVGAPLDAKDGDIELTADTTMLKSSVGFGGSAVILAAATPETRVELGGIVAPGKMGEEPFIQVDGDLVLAEGTRLDLSGLDETGTTTRVIIEVAGPEPIRGSFFDSAGSPLPEGDRVEGSEAIVSYSGGDGNDVAIRWLP